MLPQIQCDWESVWLELLSIEYWVIKYSYSTLMESLRIWARASSYHYSLVRPVIYFVYTIQIFISAKKATQPVSSWSWNLLKFSWRSFDWGSATKPLLPSDAHKLKTALLPSDGHKLSLWHWTQQIWLLHSGGRKWKQKALHFTWHCRHKVCTTELYYIGVARLPWFDA